MGENRVWEHLRSCERCFDVYQEAAIYRSQRDSGATGFESTEELVAVGLKVAAGDTAADLRDIEHLDDRIPWVRNISRYTAVAAALAMIIVTWVLIGGSDQRFTASMDPSVLAPVQKAIKIATKNGRFVLPGGESGISIPNGAVYRSGYVQVDDTLKMSLSTMFKAYQQGDYSSDLMYWLISGYVATGKIRTARDIVAHTRILDMNEPRIRIIDAIIEYAIGDYAESERLLRNVLYENPDHCIASIDLAVVLIERDEIEEARRILENVVETCKDSPLRTRAQTLLSQN